MKKTINSSRIKSRSNFYISISGGIAVGKTTLAKSLGKKLSNCLTLLENPEENPYIQDFYSDMKKWAFHSRIGMIALFAERDKKMHNSVQKYDIFLMDRCINELITFAHIQYQQENLSEKEFKTFKEILDAFIFLSPPLDIVIHLSCSSENALKRIKERKRKFESEIKPEYLLEIDRKYCDWISSLPSDTSIIPINTDNEIDSDSLVRSILIKFNERNVV